ncbi:MAG: hypothetical protein OHK0039_13410 [Bacteroidia bacterium]
MHTAPDRWIYLWVLLLWQAPALMAQNDGLRVPLWPDGPSLCASTTPDSVIVRDIGRAYIQVADPDIEVYLPVAYRRTGAAVVICPGGGYGLLAWDWEGTEMARWFNSIGVAAFVLRYRLPKAHSAGCSDVVALADAQRALRLVRSRAGTWGVDPARVGIMGFSAGGHLASTASTHFDSGNPAASDSVERQSCRPDFAILMYPVITMDTTFAHLGSRRNLLGPHPTAQQVGYFSNETQVSAQTPPTILFHASDDASVLPENSLRYYQALLRQGVPAALHLFERGGHGFALGEGKGSADQWRQLCHRWMTEQQLLVR